MGPPGVGINVGVDQGANVLLLLCSSLSPDAAKAARASLTRAVQSAIVAGGWGVMGLRGGAPILAKRKNPSG